MKILQLCCFTNLWGNEHYVESYDLRNNKDIFDIPLNYSNNFDLICAAPPCDQFTKANSHHWEIYPAHFIKIAIHCFNICNNSNKLWFIENPPGRIELFIPELKKYRIITWRSPTSNKEYIIYSNFIITQLTSIRYNRNPIKKLNNMTKKQREAWDPMLIIDIKKSLNIK